MTQPLGTQPAYQRTPLSAEERARGEAYFAPYVAETLVAKGRFRVTADTPEMVELSQKVARRVGDMLRRPVVSCQFQAFRLLKPRSLRSSLMSRFAGSQSGG